jgi:succinyl-CoA synthetase alpha subunit
MQAFRRNTLSALRNVGATQRRTEATSAYNSTVNNLKINKDTRVLFQGFTGKQGT